MPVDLPRRLVVDPSAAGRRESAVSWLSALARGTEVVLVAASRGAADDLARVVARRERATFGLHRFSLTQVAARLAATRLAATGLAPATALGTEAVAARAVFEVRRDGQLDYFAPVAGMPGFPPALSRTLTDVRMAELNPSALAAASQGGADLAVLVEAAHGQFDTGQAADRAALFSAARQALSEGGTFCSGRPVVLLDVPVHTPAERGFVETLLDQAPAWLVTVPKGDTATLHALDRYAAPVASSAPEGVSHVPNVAPGFSPASGTQSSIINRQASTESSPGLVRLRDHLFQAGEPPAGERGDDVVFFSAPGEGREAVEIARYALDEARRGVRFDEMAVLLRSPREYLGLVEHAFARAGIPGWFDRGTRRPHPAGRALLALLACADENLSARRFAEYLSLAQVPDETRGAESARHDTSIVNRQSAIDLASAPATSAHHSVGSSDPASRSSKAGGRQSEAKTQFVLPLDDVLGTSTQRLAAGDIEPVEPDAVVSLDAPSDDDPIVHGTVRAPWRWEEWLVESAVIAGRDRWRRLDGLASEYRLRLKEARREDAHSSRTAAIERDLRNLEHLRRFALPLIGELAAWPAEGTWGDWLDRLEALVPRVVRQPTVVQRVLAELRPMGAIGPVSLREVRQVLSERLRSVAVEPPSHRYGRLFVGTPEQARGRQFRVVFVPGLAERLFPQKLREDPLLPDALRQQIHADLPTRDGRVVEERLMLQLAVGAATERIYLSYPRIELREARPRVPSFYALDVMRAVTGRVPGHEELQAEAARETSTTLAWPAPKAAASAVDDFEHDLATLAPLVTSRDPMVVRGRGRYLLDLNPHLRRSLTERWKRWKPAWTEADGLVQRTPVVASALSGQRLAERPYSLTALQRYASCPYQFLMAAIYRLEPFEEPTPLQRLDPLTKGGLFHAIQAAFFRDRARSGGLPITAANVHEALAALDAAVQRVSEREREALAPAVDRVWRDEIAALRKDLRRWVTLQAEAADGWTPERFEYSFGLPVDEDHDPHSVKDPVIVGGRFRLRGSVDLVERHAATRRLRVTDHKTGKNRTDVTTTIAGGRTLQPVLYGLVVEAATGEQVEAGRLYYCTEAGQFSHHVVQLDDIARRTGLQALEIVDRAVELGFLAPCPDSGACTYCDYRVVCGPQEERRAARKNQGALADLLALRGLP